MKFIYYSKKILFYGIAIGALLTVPLQASQLIGPSQKDMATRYNSATYALHEQLKMDDAWGNRYLGALKSIESSLANNEGVKKALYSFVEIRQQKKANTVLSERTQTEVLTRYVYTLLSYFCAETVKRLNELSDAKAYWTWCKKHPKKHRLLKSPFAWFNGSDLPLQVHVKLERIIVLEKELNALYGVLNMHLAQLSNPMAEVTKSALLFLYETILTSEIREKISHTGDDFEYRFRIIGALLDQRMLFFTRYDARVALVKKPGHFARKWLPYTVVGATALAAGYACYKNQNAIEEFVSRDILDAGGYVDIVKNNFDDYCVKPVTNTWNTLTKRESLNDLSVALSELKESINSKIDGSVINGSVVDGSVIDGVDNPGLIKQLKDTQKDLEILTLDYEQSYWRYTPLWGDAKATLNEARILIARTNVDVSELKEAIILGVDVLAGLVEEQRLTLSMLGTIPVTVGLVGLYKTYSSIKNWFKKKDFHSIRAYMGELYDALVLAGNALTDEQYGRFVYVLGKLKAQADNNVPSEHKDTFIMHIKQLALPTVTVEQKKALIDNMRATYNFLSPMFIA